MVKVGSLRDGGLDEEKALVVASHSSFKEPAVFVKEEHGDGDSDSGGPCDGVETRHVFAECRVSAQRSSFKEPLLIDGSARDLGLTVETGEGSPRRPLAASLGIETVKPARCGSPCPTSRGTAMSKRCLTPFDGIEKRAAPTGDVALDAASFRGSLFVFEKLTRPKGTLSPFATKEKIKNALTVGRIGLGLVLAVLTLAGAYKIPTDFFKYTVKVVVAEPEECLEVCKTSMTDPAFAKSIGGPGVCAANADVQLATCTRTGLSYGGCKKVQMDEEGMQLAKKQADESKGMTTLQCAFKVSKPPWMACFTVATLIFSIVLMIQDMPPEVLLLGAASVFYMVGIIGSKDVFAGMASSGVTALAVLFPIADAIQETGILERIMGCVLGAPSSLMVAVPRMVLPVSLLSAFLSNTATVALMIPILTTWARRIGVHPGKLLMPLSFASQLGGAITLMGSSHCLIAATVVRGKYPSESKDMGFFDLTPCGMIIMLGSAAVMTLVAATPLLSSSAAKASCCGDVEAAPKEDPQVYHTRWIVTSSPGFAGKTLEDCGMSRIPGVYFAEKAEGDHAHKLRAGDELKVHLDENGLIALRTQSGIQLKNHAHLFALGAHRRRRFLYEVCVAPGSEFIETDILSNLNRLRQEMGACLIAGPKVPLSTVRHQILPGSVLLFEADCSWLEKREALRWSAACSMITKIPNSSPLRVGGPVDKMRNNVVILGMVALIGLNAAPLGVGLDTGGVILILFYIAIRAISVEQVFASMKVQVLLIVAGALAMGEALTKTGAVDAAADAMIKVGKPFGSVGILTMVYIAASFLSMFINNSAVIAILGPLGISIAESGEGIDVKQLAWIIVYSAGACFMTPLGYQTNLMVMPGGEYSFGDFAKFGGLIQLTHMILTVGSVALLASVLPPLPAI